MNKALNSLLFTILMLLSISCTRNGKSLLQALTKQTDFQKAFKNMDLLNKQSQNTARVYYNSLDKNVNTGMPVDNYMKCVERIFGTLPKTDSTSIYDLNFDYNKNGFIDRVKAQLSFRNLYVIYAQLVAFKGQTYKAPDGTSYTQDNDKFVAWVARDLVRTKEITDKLFDNVDTGKKGLINTEKFLTAYPFQRTSRVNEILEQQNPGGAEKIDKEKAFKIFVLIVMDKKYYV